MKDLTQGSVLSSMMSIAGFMLLAMLVQTLYSLIDLFWVGHLGPQAQAAVTLSTTVMMVAMSLANMLGTGTGALVAQAVGRKDFSAVHHYFNQSLGLGLVMTVGFGVAGWLGDEAFGRVFGADAETATLSAEFLHWFVPAMALQFPLGAAGAALRGTGNMRPVTAFQIGTVVLNMILAPLLIFGWLGMPALGVAGAGLATFCSVVAAAIGISFYFVHPKTFLRLDPADWMPQASTSWALLKIGLPAGAELLLMSVYMLVINALLKRFGAEEQAAFGIGQRLMQTGMMPVAAISIAASAVAGQNFGAKMNARVRETFSVSLKLGLGTTALICLLMFSFPAVLMGTFSDDPAVIAGGKEYLGILSFNLLAIAVAMACFGVLSGLGNTVPTLISSAIRIGLIVAPLSWLSTLPGFRPLWLWDLSLASTFVQVGLNLYFLRRELDRRLGPRTA